MTEKIDIAEILKDKPANTKLYSPLFGEVYFSHVGGDNIAVEHHGGISLFFSSGRFFDLDESEPLLFPSKEMRNWRKFAWKKGDVLVSNDGKIEVIFEKFGSDTYQSFIGKHHLGSLDENLYYQEGGAYSTASFNIETEDAAQTYINTIEGKLDGKLNLESLEIEKAQPEFKDGDIVFMKGIKGGYYANCIFILRSEYKDGDERAFYYAFYNTDDKFTIAEYGNTRVHYSLRPATDSEKQQLFDALAKKGKTWDAEKKMIVDLKPKVEFKPFDKVLCRNSKDDTWEADFFARLTRKEIDYTQSGKYLCVGDLWMYCIPYNEETAHLLGTTDEWKGGEG